MSNNRRKRICTRQQKTGQKYIEAAREQDQRDHAKAKYPLTSFRSSDQNATTVSANSPGSI